MKKKILVIASSFPKSISDTTGGGSFVFDLCMQHKNEYDIFVLAPYFSGIENKDNIQGIEIIRYKYLPAFMKGLTGESGILQVLRDNKLNYLKIPFFLFFQIINILKIIKLHNIEVIHAHWLIPQGFTAVVANVFSRKKIKILATVHGGEIWSLTGIIGNFIKKFTLKKIFNVTVVSSAIKKKVNNYDYKGEIDIVPMGVNTQLFNPLRKNPLFKKNIVNDNIFVLFTGYFDEKKGIKYLIRAIPAILESYKDIVFIFIGDGSLLEECKQLANKLNVQNHVKFLGKKNRRELPDYFANADIVIGPSVEAKDGDKEGLPVVYMEAMSSGSILIGTDLEGNYDILKHKENGIMIGQKDPQAIAGEIIDVIENLEEYEYMRKNARKFAVENYSWEIIGKKYSDIYKELLK